MEYLLWLEQTGFGTWVRESPSLWAYPAILFLHTLGMGTLAGTAAIIDLKIIGVAPDLPIAPLERFFPLMWVGFWINALSGAALFVADATTKLTNPVFVVKMMFVVLGVVTVHLLRDRVFRAPVTARREISPFARVLAGASLVSWAGALTAGRLMAYLGPVSGLPQ